jgi:Icc-related predicted phosphoesterase
MNWTRTVSVFLLCLAIGRPGAQSPTPVSGVVYEDANGNGRRDEGERGLSGVAVSNQHEVVVTAADGTYVLPHPGFGIVFVSVPDGYRTVGRFWRTVPVSGSNEPAEFALQSRPVQEAFTFIHASDTHVSKQSVDRLQQFRAIVEARRPDFVLVTGDLVRDALRVGEEEARGYYDLYVEETGRFPVPVWSVPGNHENFGIERHLSLVSSSHPLYGKGMYRQRLGPNYYSFNYGGVHFVGLDSVDISDLWYYGHIDPVQLAWLKADLERLPTGASVVTFNHIPFVSAVEGIDGYRDDGPAPTLIKVNGRTVFRHIVSNFKEALTILQARDWALALGGHFHTREMIRYASAVRTRFHQAAAVVGPTDNPVPAISGVTLYRVNNRVIDDGEFIPLPTKQP